MAEYQGIIELGGLYKNGVIQNRPTKPWKISSEPVSGVGVGDIPDFNTLTDMSKWVIGDTPSNSAQKLKWHKIKDGSKTLLICDRNILANVSWNDLNGQSLVSGKTITIDGQQYLIRLLTGGSNYRSGSDIYSGGAPSNNEWDRFITREEAISGLAAPVSSDLDSTLNTTDKDSTHNKLWNWFGMYSWTQETYTGNSSYRAFRGFDSARCWYYDAASGRYVGVGWRPVLEVLNTAPVISDSDSNLGNKLASFTVNYSVNDTDTGDTLTVTEKVDGTTLRTINNAVCGQTYTLDLSSVWSTLALGSHTITITVNDGKGGTATRTYTFTKTDDRIKFTLKNPIETSIAAKKLVVSGVMTVPNGATLSVKACNNGFDASPTWEDITQKFLSREVHTFVNTTKTATKWGINIEFEILKGTATEQIIIDGFGFSFE